MAFLSREVPRWSRENKCFSCHNNGDAARALYAASALGYRVPRAALTDTTDWLQHPDRWEDNKGDPAFSDKRLATIQFTSALAAAIETKHAPDRSALLAAARALEAQQNTDGAWSIEPAGALGSPATYGTQLATAAVIRSLVTVGDRSVAAARGRAQRWLGERATDNVLSAAAALIGLHGDETPVASAKRKECLKLIRRSQARDGGWGPYPDSPPEPFDTAVVLLALMENRDGGEFKSLLHSGRDYLIETQNADGSWPETTRPALGESYAQRISTTGWATLALLRTRDLP